MSFKLDKFPSLSDLPFDQIIDVRSPSEFAQDHLPNAVNLPVLDDDERAEVGTLYVQTSRFQARKKGAALVSANAARHLQGALLDKKGDYRPLVYCWRGGQRSGSFTMILAQIGWRAEVLDGGYRSYRQLVSRMLYEDKFPAQVVVLGGNTGTAKTDILKRLQSLNVQVIDLEGLANHRGSLFGHRPGGQPSQKAFESALAMEITALDPRRPVVLEAESSKVGQLNIPPSLWKAMLAAPRITVQAQISERAKYLARAYRDVTENTENLLRIIAKLRPLHSAEQINQWQNQAREGAFEALATGLMLTHYDRRYKKQSTEVVAKGSVNISLDDLSADGLDIAAANLCELVEKIHDRSGCSEQN